MIWVIGEVLVDRFPTYRRMGGAPYNFAFHLKKLGHDVRFFSRVGDDPDGGMILEKLARTGFDTRDIQVDPDHPTGVVNVTLDTEGGPRFSIEQNAAWDHLDTDRLAAASPKPEMLYFATLIQRTKTGAQRLQGLLDRLGPKVRCFCDINLRPPHYSRQSVETCLKHARILKLSAQELDIIFAMTNETGPADQGAARLIKGRGIEVLAVTLGADGSFIVTENGRLDIPARTNQTTVDTVGAGDAYAAVLAHGILQNRPLKETGEAAAALSSRICGIKGAVPGDGEEERIYGGLFSAAFSPH